MQLLVDTQMVLWFVLEDKRLPAKVSKALENPRNECFVSVGSYWEIAVKHALGRLELKGGLATTFSHIQSDFSLLDIRLDHIQEIAQLPNHHTDPFDRLLLAQAQVEGLTIVTSDQYFIKYDIPLLIEPR
jgi:PIN domain nuclease of toxin-antitoxin system